MKYGLFPFWRQPIFLYFSITLENFLCLGFYAVGERGGGEVFAVCGVEIAEKVRLTSAPAQPYILELILQGEQ